MKSFHLPSEITNELSYGNIAGDDTPGTYRDSNVEYVPMEWVGNINNVTNPNSRAIYFDDATGRYMQHGDNGWSVVSSSRIDEVLDTKAYIDMPNQTYYTFLNPRTIFMGLSLTFHF